MYGSKPPAVYSAFSQLKAWPVGDVEYVMPMSTVSCGETVLGRSILSTEPMRGFGCSIVKVKSVESVALYTLVMSKFQMSNCTVLVAWITFML